MTAQTPLNTRELTEVPTHTDQEWCLEGINWEFSASITETMRFSLGFFLLWSLEQKEEEKKPVGRNGGMNESWEKSKKSIKATSEI